MVLVFDTDPGVDDTLALLLLLSEPKVRNELALITLTFGNCALSETLANVLSLFSVIEKEHAYRQKAGLAPFTDQKPTIHVGAAGPIPSAFDNSEREDAKYVHGSDGLAGIHALRPEFDAPQEWFELFSASSTDSVSQNCENLPFKPSKTPSWRAILDLLASEPENTVTIIAVGPLTNLALAASADMATFSRVKQVLSMGAAIDVPGNVTPQAEFNVFADPIAAAQIYALTSPNPRSTMPTSAIIGDDNLKCPPLDLVLFALDVTTQHRLMLDDVKRIVGNALNEHPNSVLAEWVNTWLTMAFRNYGRIVGRGPENAVINLHDPLTAMYALKDPETHWESERLDVRVESFGQWTKGMTVTDRRGKVKEEKPFTDRLGWVTLGLGNDIAVVRKTGIEDSFGTFLLERALKFRPGK